MKRFAVLVSLVALFSAAFASPVLAAAPSNDTYAGRTIISAIPFADLLDTSEATTDADDVEINDGCAPATDASVWYELTLTTDATVLVEVSGSDYSAGVLVATGSPGTFSTQACGPGAVPFEAVAGEPYAILVFDDQLDGEGIGGTLTISVDEAPPPPTIDIEIDPEGTYNPITDVATVSGTLTCSEPLFVEISVTVFQNIGRHVVIGGGFAEVECGPEGTSGPVEISGFTSTFNPGTVTVVADAVGCTFSCAEAHAEGQVRLRPAPEQPAPPPPPPSNDEPGGAFTIGLDAPAAQDTSGATMGATDPTECVTEPAPPADDTVWYAFTAPADGFYEASTIGSDYDTVLFVLAPDGSTAACDDDVVPGEDQDSLAIFEGTSGATYLIMVGSFFDSPGGALVLSVTETDELPPLPPPAGDPPVNDERTNAIPLGVGSSIGPIDTTSATAAADDPQPSCSPPSGHTAWYSLTAETAGWVEITTAGSDFDTTLVVLADGVEIACNDDFQTVESRVVFFAEPGVTYEVMAGSFGGSPGGMLVLSALSSEPPLMVEIATGLQALVDSRSGEVTLRGTVTCSDEASVEIFAGLDQQNGRFGVTGESGTVVEGCSPDGTPFALTFAGNEAYRPGDAMLFIEAVAFTEDEHAFADFAGTIRLRPGGAGR